MSRHEFLFSLHKLLKPQVYLETGVQAGISLALSEAPVSIGIDPAPLQQAYSIADNTHKIYTMTSDEFFAIDHTHWRVGELDRTELQIDLAFIDGMHLAEYAWRDFVNIARYAHKGTVVVLDDVLPYTTDMAAREICPGDWTGDVWRVPAELKGWSDLVVQLVDTAPTGTCVVTGFGDKAWSDLRRCVEFEEEQFEVPDWALDRRHAWKAEHVLENLRDRGFAK